MKRVIFEKDYNKEEVIDIADDIVDTINEAQLPLDKDGFFKGTLSIQVTYSDYQGE